MKQAIFSVVRVDDVVQVKSATQPDKVTKRRSVVLREWGSKFGDEFVCMIVGDAADAQLKAGDVCIAAIQFRATEYNGRSFQDATIYEIATL